MIFSNHTLFLVFLINYSYFNVIKREIGQLISLITNVNLNLIFKKVWNISITNPQFISEKEFKFVS